MKKILFMCINMNIGGTEKALLNMLSEISLSQYEVTLLMLEKYGGFLDYIPKEVHIKYLKDFKSIKPILNNPPQQTALSWIKQGNVIKGIRLLGIHLGTKIMGERSLFYKYIIKDYPVLTENYDLAVAYAGPMDFISYFIAHKVKATKKVQWIHFDVTQIDFNPLFAKKVYSKFDKIFVVSKEGKNKLIKVVPSLAEKIDTFYNIVSSPLIIRKQSTEGLGFSDNYLGTRILTVGRLSEEKGQDRCIEVLARLKREGYQVRWYVLGDGNSRSIYEDRVKELGLEQDFIFLGAQMNPYPYMKQCDIYMQPSRHEGYCITLAEAKCFNHPIVTTDFTGASEQIKTYNTGIVVKGGDRQIYQAIKELLDDDELFLNIRRNLSNQGMEESKEINKIYGLLRD